MQVTIQPAHPQHVRWLIIDGPEVDAMIRAGLNPTMEVDCLIRSSEAWSISVDGRIVAIWGIDGCILSHSGHVWLAASSGARRFPFRFVRMAISALRGAFGIRRELFSYLLVGDERSKRFLGILGFRLEGSDVPGYHRVVMRSGEP